VAPLWNLIKTLVGGLVWFSFIWWLIGKATPQAVI